MWGGQGSAPSLATAPLPNGFDLEHVLRAGMVAHDLLGSGRLKTAPKLSKNQEWQFSVFQRHSVGHQLHPQSSEHPLDVIREQLWSPLKGRGL